MSSSPNDRELLREVARRIREEQEEEALHGARWDELTAEVMELHGAEAFGEDFQRGVLGKLRGEIGMARGGGEAAASDSVPAAGGAKLVDLSGRRRQASSRASRRRWQASLAAGLLLVLGGSLWLLLRAPSGDPPADLPAYSLAAARIREERSAEEEGTAARPGPVEVVPGYRFEAWLRPRSSVAERLEARVFVAPHGGTPQAWGGGQRRLESFEGGVFVLRDLSAADWRPLGPGDWTIFFAVGRPGSLPSRDRLRRMLGEGTWVEAGDWQLLRLEIRLVEAP